MITLEQGVMYEWTMTEWWEHKAAFAALAWCAAVAIAAYVATRPKRVFFLDYACSKPADEQKCSYEMCVYFVQRTGRYAQDTVEFMRGVFLKSGLGNETYVPSSMIECSGDATLAVAIKEAEDGIFSAVDALLAKTGVPAALIDVVVVTSSVHWPAPSLTAMIVNRYGLGPGTKTFNLSGMGCGGGALAMDLAGRVLRGRTRGYALVVATESTSLNWYFGNNRSMLVANCIFRVGAAAVLMTSDPARRGQAMMELTTSVRTHHGADDAAYGCACVKEDEEGTMGVELSKDLVRVAGAALREHIRLLAVKILPVSELLRYAVAAARAAGRGKGEAAPPVPDFTRGVEHMCFHTGGKAVISRLERLLRLPGDVVEPAKMTLHRFGNTSSSSIFYELAYFDAKKRIKKGDRMWMIAFGSGFKVCSLVWVALRNSRLTADNPWSDCAHIYPVPFPI